MACVDLLAMYLSRMPASHLKARVFSMGHQVQLGNDKTRFHRQAGVDAGGVLIKCDGETSFFTPDDCAAAHAIVRNDSQREFVGNLFNSSNVEGGTVRRDAAYDAICFRTAEAD